MEEGQRGFVINEATTSSIILRCPALLENFLTNLNVSLNYMNQNIDKVLQDMFTMLIKESLLKHDALSIELSKIPNHFINLVKLLLCGTVQFRSLIYSYIHTWL